jgi:hypothetical protein
LAPPLHRNGEGVGGWGFLPRDAQLDAATLGELGGVREQVEQRLTEFGLVGVHRAQVVRTRDDEGVAVLLDQRLHDGDHVLYQPPDLEVLQEEVHPAGLDPGEVEDVVDQP